MPVLRLVLFFALFLPGFSVIAQKDSTSPSDKKEYPKALVSYDDFKNLVTEVEAIREKRLLDFDTFLAMQEEPHTVVLDTRSRDMYQGKHLKGAIHLPFTEFTQSNLRRLIPDTSTRILIYCNNNFEGDPFFFASKTFNPSMAATMDMLSGKKPIMLALNIPTYLNLYGYGYTNIYELHELVKVDDPRVTFEGKPNQVKGRTLKVKQK